MAGAMATYEGETLPGRFKRFRELVVPDKVHAIEQSAANWLQASRTKWFDNHFGKGKLRSGIRGGSVKELVEVGLGFGWSESFIGFQLWVAMAEREWAHSKEQEAKVCPWATWLEDCEDDEYDPSY